MSLQAWQNLYKVSSARPSDNVLEKMTAILITPCTLSIPILEFTSLTQIHKLKTIV